MSINYYHTQLQKIKNSDNKDLFKMHYEGHDVFLKLIDESKETITLLTKWRKQYRNNFGSDFTIDENKTKKWIKEQVLSNIDKIVFLIYVDNQKIGIISTSEYDEDTNSAILDTMMKDPKFELPGLMTTIEKVYLKWMFDGLKLEKIRGVLFSDNLKMMKIHTKCGWKLLEVVPIEQTKTKDGIKWVKSTLKKPKRDIERYYNIIELVREDLMKNFNDIQCEVLCD